MPRYLALAVLFTSVAVAQSSPNIVFVLCDDLGYGDVQCLNPESGKIPTPNANQLAREGMIFTDAHSGSSVCTPTRYGIMTGRYSWRTRLQKGVVQGFAPSLISSDRPTVASFLKSRGYDTAAVGKWHLNLRYQDPKRGKDYRKNEYDLPPVGARIPDGPVHRGFDTFHGFHHARHMKAVIENDCVIAHDQVINMLPRLIAKSVGFIASRTAGDRPFFLYLPLGSPHTPIVPTDAWKGRSGLGDYGDFVMQTDHALGQVMHAIADRGLAENTLLIFSSDNGCSRAANIRQLSEKGHKVSAGFRGSKADIWDGGHRIPFIARWPGTIQPGSHSDQLICLTDLFATMAEMVGATAPQGSCEDSVSFLPALRGEPVSSTRRGIVHHSVSGHFAYRTANWKLILARASGGWSSPNEKQAAGSQPAQLYDMAADPGERVNLYREQPEVVQRLLAHLQSDIASGRSTTGAESKNDIHEINLWKSGRE